MADGRRPVTAALGGLVALAVAMGIGRFVYTPILPFMEAGLGLDKAAAGLIASANYLGYLLGASAALWNGLADRRYAWFLGGLVASGLTTAAMGLTGSVPMFLLLRFASGVASAFVLVFGSGIVLDRLAAASRPGLSAVHFAGVGCGIAVSATLVALLHAAGAGWRSLWWASGLVSLVALLLVMALVPAGARRQAGETATAGRPIGPALMALVIAYGLFGFGYVITATFISSIVRDSASLRAVEPVVWLVVGLTAAPSVVLWMLVGRRLGNAVSFALACLAEAAGVALSVLATTALGVLVAAALLGGTFMGIVALGLVHARALGEGDPRQVLALMTAAFGLGQMIGPTFAGYGYEFTGSFTLPSLAAAAALVLAAGLVMGFRRPSPHRPR
jgi:predicted MFS family arabinose efflux permease